MIGMNPAYGDEFVEYHWRIELLDYESWLLVETFTKADDTNPIGVVAGELDWSILNQSPRVVRSVLLRLPRRLAGLIGIGCWFGLL